MSDAGFAPHDFAYDDVREADIVFIIGANPYENQSVFFMQYLQGKEMIVMDPRRTATAQYAVQTGGLHLQPTRLGADPLVLYAMARALIERGIESELIVGGPSDLKPKREEWTKWRRKSRALDFAGFKEFLGVDPPSSTLYTLKTAASVSGIVEDDLIRAIDRLVDATSNPVKSRKVAILYEKGMIWGFNYHNTSAVASLGVLLSSYKEPGRLVGRLGGHQKGWAESGRPVEIFEGAVGGYPYERAFPNRKKGDRYSDSYLVEVGAPDNEILVKHNLDNHMFGPTEDLHADQSGIESWEVRLRNNLVTRKEPDVKLLWIIGGNYLGQTNDSATKRNRLMDRMRAGEARIVRPKHSDLANLSDAIKILKSRMARGGVVAVYQDIFPNPTMEFCDIVIPAAGWGEDTFCRYNAQRRLKLYERFQDMPLHPVDASKLAGKDPLPEVDTFDHSPKPDWLIIRDIAQEIGRRTGVDLSSIFGWETSSILADEMAQDSNRGLAGSNKNTGQSMLGDLLLYGQQPTAYTEVERDPNLPQQPDIV